MNLARLKLYLAGAAILIAIAGYNYWAHEQREKGALRERNKSLVAREDTLKKQIVVDSAVIDSLKTRARADSLALTKAKGRVVVLKPGVVGVKPDSGPAPDTVAVVPREVTDLIEAQDRRIAGLVGVIAAQDSALAHQRQMIATLNARIATVTAMKRGPGFKTGVVVGALVVGGAAIIGGL
jgi:hypothetical protein